MNLILFDLLLKKCIFIMIIITKSVTANLKKKETDFNKNNEHEFQMFTRKIKFLTC